MKFEKRAKGGEVTPASSEMPDTGKKPVIIYILILFLAAFLLMFLSLLAHQRSNAEALGQLQNSVTAIQEIQTSQEQVISLQEVPVIVIEADDRKAAELAMIENLQREDLNPMEEAAGFQSLIENYHMTQEEAAQQVGKSRSAVTNALRLLGLPPAVRKLVEENKLSAGHARALVPLSPSLQESAANAILTGGLSVRQTEALVKRLSAEKKEPKKNQADAVDYLAEAQNELKAKLCRGVKIVSGRKKGRIELEYYGLDDLNDLLDALALIKINKAKEGPQA